jgi:vacuolar-type H+-ATPase subunit I/STV1
MNGMGGIGKQIAQDLSELGISSVKATAQAAKDVAVGSMETLVSSGSSGLAGQKTNGEDMHKKQEEEKKKQEKTRVDTARMREVQDEIKQYLTRKRQLDARIAQDRDRETAQKKQVNDQKKVEKESWLQAFMGRVGRQSHGESTKNKG